MNIVLGYIDTPEGRAALDRAVQEARLRNAHLIVVHSARSDRDRTAGEYYTRFLGPESEEEDGWFDWLWELIGSERNNYDKIGHLAQGFIPAIAAREILLRFGVVKGKGWLAFLVVCFCLALSAFYELLEWWVALLSEEAAESFLGTQGYVWDTQSDMWYALLGAVLALVLLSKLHDRQLEALSR